MKCNFSRKFGSLQSTNLSHKRTRKFFARGPSFFVRHAESVEFSGRRRLRIKTMKKKKKTLKKNRLQKRVVESSTKLVPRITFRFWEYIAMRLIERIVRSPALPTALFVWHKRAPLATSRPFAVCTMHQFQLAKKVPLSDNTRAHVRAIFSKNRK